MKKGGKLIITITIILCIGMVILYVYMGSTDNDAMINKYLGLWNQKQEIKYDPTGVIRKYVDKTGNTKVGNQLLKIIGNDYALNTNGGSFNSSETDGTSGGGSNDTPTVITPSNGDTGTTVPTGGSLGMSKDEQLKIIAQKLKSMGYNKTAIAGFLGNFYIEGYSYSYYPSKKVGDNAGDDTIEYIRTNNKRIGFGQWGSSRRDGILTLAESMNKNWYDLDVQIAFMATELSGGWGYSSHLKPSDMNSLDLDHCTFLVARWYEVCTTSSSVAFDERNSKLQNYSERYNTAQIYLTKLEEWGYE